MGRSTGGDGRVGLGGDISRQVEVGGARFANADPVGASMDADLDLLLIAVYCTADDLLPKKMENARRILTDAEVVTLCVAQSLLGLHSDEKFWATVPKRLGHLFPQL